MYPLQQLKPYYNISDILIREIEQIILLEAWEKIHNMIIFYRDHRPKCNFYLNQAHPETWPPYCQLVSDVYPYGRQTCTCRRHIPTTITDAHNPHLTHFVWCPEWEDEH